ncbi:hypothetical protein N341_08774, partial [Tyto alba]
GSKQIVELMAAIQAFQLFNAEPVNIVADSEYVTGTVMHLGNAFIKQVDNRQLFQLLFLLADLLKKINHSYFIVHIHSHTNLPGSADQLIMAVNIPCKMDQAKIAHQFFHQNAQSLRKFFSLTMEQAQSIIRACEDCQHLAPLPLLHATKPRGLQANKLWQMDVTHIPSFGKLKYVHVTVDTFSGFVVATVRSSKKTKDVIRHFLRSFASIAVPKQIKTDDGPAYTSHKLIIFQVWRITHVTGIPHSPTGQAIVELMHHFLKTMLEKQ